MSVASSTVGTAEKRKMIHSDMLFIVATCIEIATNNPRVTPGSVSPLLKPAKNFSKFLNNMEPEEIINMAKAFYIEYSMRPMASDSWLDNDVSLIFGDEADNILLRLSQYARVAKEMKHNEYDTLRYHCTRLIRHMASPIIAENLDERLLPLEKKLGKGTAAAAGAAAGSLSALFGGASMGGIGELLQSAAKSLFDTTASADGGDGPADGLKSMLTSPAAVSMVRSMTASLPPQLQGQLDPMINDMEQGRLDPKVILQRVMGMMQSAAAPGPAPVDERPQIRLVPNAPEPLTEDEPVLSTADVIIPTLPDQLGGTCVGDVCYPHDG